MVWFYSVPNWLMKFSNFHIPRLISLIFKKTSALRWRDFPCVKLWRLWVEISLLYFLELLTIYGKKRESTYTFLRVAVRLRFSSVIKCGKDNKKFINLSDKLFTNNRGVNSTVMVDVYHIPFSLFFWLSSMDAAVETKSWLPFSITKVFIPFLAI